MTIPTKKLDYWSQKGATQAPKNLREKNRESTYC